MAERDTRPLVSVVVPVFNASRYLQAALRSVRSQAYRPLEIVAVDDGSTDDSGSIARAFPQVRVIRQTNRGPGAARNAGVAHSSGQYLAFLDADDLWLPGKLEAQAARLRTDPSLDAVFCRVVEFQSEELSEAERRLHMPRSGAHLARLASALMIRRSSFERTSGFIADSNEGWELFDWTLRAQEAGVSFGAVEEAYVRRRLHTTNIGIRKATAQRAGYIRALRRSLDRRASPLGR